jgi:protein associated with RNAse G/E
LFVFSVTDKTFTGLDYEKNDRKNGYFVSLNQLVLAIVEYLKQWLKSKNNISLFELLLCPQRNYD